MAGNLGRCVRASTTLPLFSRLQSEKWGSGLNMLSTSKLLRSPLSQSYNKSIARHRGCKKTHIYTLTGWVCQKRRGSLILNVR